MCAVASSSWASEFGTLCHRGGTPGRDRHRRALKLPSLRSPLARRVIAKIRTRPSLARGVAASFSLVSGARRHHG